MDKNILLIMRHSCEHVLTQAMLKLYPEIKMAMGPATDEGFYFDFDPCETKISVEDFGKIEKEMEKIVKQNLPITRHIIDIKEAKMLFKKNKYKMEWIEEIIKKKEKASIYKTGEAFTDLCSGPHLASTGKIGPFKLMSLAGAYWHGDEKNKMLTRIYGTCFPTKKELDDYLWSLDEAKRRDHRILGKSLQLFVINDYIGKGLPLLTPKGTMIRKQILDYEYELERLQGFQHVITPHIARSELYKKTGHWQHYRDVMYESFGIEGEEYVLKPMNCPHHYMIYSSVPRSYKDLPYRLSEPGTCYRFEKTGELSGLIRVRALTIDDSHILMTEDQIESEFKRCIDLVHQMFKVFNLKDYYVRLSLSDPSDAIKYIADKGTWEKAKIMLEKIVKDNKLNYKIAEGEASFYGPKLDYMVRDSLNREWQMSTLQLDLFMGKRLNLTYTDKDGSLKHPVILHRGLTGSIERTLAILIEHFAGAFPLWLSPIQLILIPISEKHLNFVNQLHQYLLVSGIRSEVDARNESMQSKIRDATLQKVPYMGIIGDKEIVVKQSGDNDILQSFVSLRKRGGQNMGKVKINELISNLKEEIEKKL